ncbi:MAG: low-specificity L-threonine aldolase [Gemmataceae bacterium]|mgnify:CR=1 FL=1
MVDEWIDLRSDTVTRPTPGMRAAMAAAEVGDDVFREDPTVNRLEERVAELLGKEAALFVPSGTMSNQICIRAQTQPGDEIICDVNSHIYNYEAGGPAVLSGVMCRTVEGEYGILDVRQLQGLVRPVNDHLVRTRLVCLENTHNRGGGRIFPLERVEAIGAWAHAQGLLVHLDGARLWNASVATGIAPKTWAARCDSVSVCFSKGLGAPVGSALAGSRDLVARARRIRKVLGGGMRQAGVLAAAALYALDHHIERLAEDHEHARMLAEALAGCHGVTLTPPDVHTNIVIFQVAPDLASAHQIVETLKEQGVLALAIGPQSIRLCTHLDVSRRQAERAARILRQVLMRGKLISV